jgi:FkbM family methyltransferase
MYEDNINYLLHFHNITDNNIVSIENGSYDLIENVFNEKKFILKKNNLMFSNITDFNKIFAGEYDILDYFKYIYIDAIDSIDESLSKNYSLENIDTYLKKYNFKKITNYDKDCNYAFYAKNIFNISSNLTFEYGTDTIKLDITNIVFKNCITKNIIYIPSGDNSRASLFGDPIYGTLKQIFITSENKRYIIEHNDFAYIDTETNKLYINEEIPINKTHDLSIMAIFKNETMNLRVWLEHYLWQGVEHFYLIDNGSTDNPLHILQEYIDKDIVTYYFRSEKHQQVKHYRYVFDKENIKEKTKWLCICDLDEFFFGTEKKLIDTLDEFDEYNVIYTNSFFYGSDNLIEHPKDIRTGILHREEDIENGTKYIFKPSSINNSSEIWIHWLVHIGSLQKKSMPNETFDNTKIRLNHYRIQSLEYFKNVKMTRGDVSTLENESIRDLSYFEHYEKISTIKDEILKQIIEQNIYNKNGEVMKFYDENNNIIDNNSIEKPEQDLVNSYILEDDIVLELGARYGTVSCNINKKLNNKYNQVSVEPDDSVWFSLELNKIKNNCNFNIVKGFISNKKMNLHLDGYGSTFVFDENTKIHSYSLDDIKNQYNIEKFNVLVADCEGFLEVFFDENPTFYNDLRLIMFEADYADKCNYNKIKQNLFNNNFIKIIEGHQNVWIKKNN